MRPQTATCMRCLTPTPATQCTNICVEEERFTLSLCAAHADRLATDLALWTNLVEEATEHRAPIKFGEQRKRDENNPVPFPVIVRPPPPVETAPEAPAPSPATVVSPARSNSVRTDTAALRAVRTPLFQDAMRFPPGADEWTINPHARKQAKLPDRALTNEEILWTAVRPHITHPDKWEKDVAEHRRNGVGVVVNTVTKEVITCYRLTPLDNTPKTEGS